MGVRLPMAERILFWRFCDKVVIMDGAFMQCLSGTVELGQIREEVWGGGLRLGQVQMVNG